MSNFEKFALAFLIWILGVLFGYLWHFFAVKDQLFGG